MNTFKSTLLWSCSPSFLIFIGDRFGGRNGNGDRLCSVRGVQLRNVLLPDKLALSMYRAQPITREELPRAYSVVERLAAKQGLPMPAIYVIRARAPTPSPRTQPEHASVAVTRGIPSCWTTRSWRCAGA